MNKSNYLFPKFLKKLSGQKFIEYFKNIIMIKTYNQKMWSWPLTGWGSD